MKPREALERALTMEGINFADERSQRILERLRIMGLAVTEIGNPTEWKDREPQLLGLVQDEI